MQEAILELVTKSGVVTKEICDCRLRSAIKSIDFSDKDFVYETPNQIIDFDLSQMRYMYTTTATGNSVTDIYLSFTYRNNVSYGIFVSENLFNNFMSQWKAIEPKTNVCVGFDEESALVVYCKNVKFVSGRKMRIVDEKPEPKKIRLVKVDAPEFGVQYARRGK